MLHELLKDISKTNKYSFGELHLGDVEISLMFTVRIIAYQAYYHIKDMMLLK